MCEEEERKAAIERLIDMSVNRKALDRPARQPRRLTLTITAT